MKIILFCVTLDLSDNLIEMCIMKNSNVIFMISKTGKKKAVRNLGMIPGVMEQAKDFMTIISTVHKVQNVIYFFLFSFFKIFWRT